MRPFLPEIQEFVRHTHIDVLHEIERYVPLDFEIHGHQAERRRIRLLALGLELPEDTLVNIHNYHEKNNSYCGSSFSENEGGESIPIMI